MDTGLSPEPIDKRISEALKAVVGPRGWLAGDDADSPYLTDWRGHFRGRAALIVVPASVAEAAEIVRLCAESGTPLVPQGGNTGLCGGATPSEDGTQVLLSLVRLNQIRGIDAANYTMCVEAGCLLSVVQQAAFEENRLFPLSLGAEGSCCVGGNISTNAGGVNVLRFGNTRDLVLGLEVILPNGRVWNGLNELRKNNTGYDLKQLFIGAEGTLGVVTAAVLKLFPLPMGKVTAFMGVETVGAAVGLLDCARKLSGDSLTAFEIMPRLAVESLTEHLALRNPLGQAYPWAVLIELSSARSPQDAESLMAEIWSEAQSSGLVLDGTVAESIQQQEQLWALRESIPQAQRFLGGSIKHDVSVPISAAEKFVRVASEAVCGLVPGARVMAFGHLGDGNLHFNISQPRDMNEDAFLTERPRVNRLVHDIVMQHGGSISAEHGIGRLKRGELGRYKSELELEMMRSIKAALDPRGIMNPGKVLPGADMIHD